MQIFWEKPPNSTYAKLRLHSATSKYCQIWLKLGSFHFYVKFHYHAKVRLDRGTYRETDHPNLGILLSVLDCYQKLCLLIYLKYLLKYLWNNNLSITILIILSFQFVFGFQHRIEFFLLRYSCPQSWHKIAYAELRYQTKSI